MLISVPMQTVGVWVISILVGWYGINPIIRTLTYQFLTRIYGPTLWEHPQTSAIQPPRYQWWLPRFIGAIEQSIATASILTGRIEVIGIWLVMKTTGAWSTQHKDAHPSALTTDYSIFLIGTALSVGLGVGTAFIIQNWLPLF
jgi:hypothetical protein